MDRLALRQRLQARLEQLLDEALASKNPPRTLDQVEALAVELGRKAQEQIAQELATCAQEQAQAGVQSDPAAKPPAQGRCAWGRSAWYKGEPAHTWVRMAGPVRGVRSSYSCRRCDAGFCPADRVLGRGTGRSRFGGNRNGPGCRGFWPARGPCSCLGS